MPRRSLQSSGDGRILVPQEVAVRLCGLLTRQRGRGKFAAAPLAPRPRGGFGSSRSLDKGEEVRLSNDCFGCKKTTPKFFGSCLCEEQCASRSENIHGEPCVRRAAARIQPKNPSPLVPESAVRSACRATETPLDPAFGVLPCILPVGGQGGVGLRGDPVNCEGDCGSQGPPVVVVQ